MPTIFSEAQRAHLLARFETLSPEKPPQWGTLSASAMIVHLCDQLRMTLGEHKCAPVPGVWRYMIFREAFLNFRFMWGPGQQGPPEAFLTVPTTWADGMASLRHLLDRVVTREQGSAWPEHPNLGRMSRRAWGIFTYRHFDHHLRQFDA